MGEFTDWRQVSGGGNHNVAVRANGTVWAWGANTLGPLGDNTTVNKSSPVSVVGGFTDWIQVSAGSNHTVAVRANGSMWTWGYNNRGQLGDATTTARSSPGSVVGGITNWIQVSAAYQSTLAVTAGGTARGWGLNTYGHLS